MTTLAVGDRFEIVYLAYNDSGVLTDTTVALTVTDPTGTTTTPSMTHASTGTYTYDLTLSLAGVWYYDIAATVTVIEDVHGQVTAETPGPVLYASLALLKQTVNILTSDTTRDDLLTNALSAASRSVEKYCDKRLNGFTLATMTSQRIYQTRGKVVRADSWGGEKLYVDDIGDSTSIVVETSDDNVTWTAQSPVEFWPYNALDYNEPVTAVISPWPSTIFRTSRLVRVTARWGWPEIPSAVEQATLLQAMRLFKRPSSPEGVAGTTDWGLVRIPNMDPDVKALLAYLSTPTKVA